MNTPAQTQLIRLLPLTLIFSAAPIAHAANELTILGTPEPREVETEAIEIFNSPAVKAQIAASKQLFLASPVAATDESNSKN